MKLLDKIVREEQHPKQLLNPPRFTFANVEPCSERSLGGGRPGLALFFKGCNLSLVSERSGTPD